MKKNLFKNSFVTIFIVLIISSTIYSYYFKIEDKNLQISDLSEFKELNSYNCFDESRNSKQSISDSDSPFNSLRIEDFTDNYLCNYFDDTVNRTNRDNPISSRYETIKWEDSHHYPGTADDPKLSLSAEIVFPDAFHNWSFRKEHTIIPSAGAGTDYQVRFFVHFGSGMDSGGKVFLNGQCQADFDDIRFTSSDAKTELDYWVQETHFGENATV